MAATPPERIWGEDDSDVYRRLSDVAVPERERQIDIVTTLVAASTADGDVLDICCGEGLLAEAVLKALPEVRVIACDGSQSMLAATRERCGGDDRLEIREINLSDRAWRVVGRPLKAAISSLAVHHLDAAGKQALFADLFAALAPGGVFVLADVIRPATRAGNEIAARLWDEEAGRRSLAIAGDLSGLEAFQAADWNHFRHEVIDPMDKPSSLAEHLDWLHAAGFADVDVHWMLAGQAIFSAWKR